MVLKIVSLNESSRKDLLTKSRRESQSRFKKRFNYQVTNFKGVNLFQLFENDYFVFQTPINEYVCTIAFPGVLTELRRVVKSTNGNVKKINLQMVIKSLRIAFDKTDEVKVRCTCADFKYRFMYWANRNGYLYGPLDKGTEEFPEKTNPDDRLGSTCKHLNLFLSNKRWLVKAASVVNALIKAYPEKASLYLYDEESFDQLDENEIDSTSETSEDSDLNEVSEENEVDAENKEIVVSDTDDSDIES